MRAIVLLVVLSACGADDADSSAHEACITETNRYRTFNGKAAVVRDSALEDFADTGAMVDFAGSPHQHFSSTSGGGIAFAENECPHWSADMTAGDLSMLVVSCIGAFYNEGPGAGDAHGHYNNMMGSYGTLGCGIYQSGTEVTIVQDYGH